MNLVNTIGRLRFRKAWMRALLLLMVSRAVGTSNGAPTRTKSFCISTITNADFRQWAALSISSNSFAGEVSRCCGVAKVISGRANTPAVPKATFFKACLRVIFMMAFSGYKVQGTRYEVRGTRYEVRGTRYEVRGTRYEV